MLAALMLIAVCGCGIGGVAIRRGAVAPPQFALDLGVVQALGRLSTVPGCSYATACLLDPSGRDTAIYTVWLILRPARPDAPVRTIRLVSIVVDDGS
jgi:hypothetical protein